MKFILGQKIEMTQKFKEDGRVVPVTLVKAGPCTVIRVKKQDLKDGYDAVQVGYGLKRKLNKPLAGQLKGLANFRFIKEFRTKEDNLARGQKITVEIFQPGDLIQATGISKGKGFQGVVRRHHFHGHPTTHGHKDQTRMPGSISAGGVQRVFKGRRMAGHMGAEQTTVKNLEIIEVDKENNILAIKGAVPGYRNSLVIIEGEGELKFSPSASSGPMEAAKGAEGAREDKVEEKSVEAKKEPSSPNS